MSFGFLMLWSVLVGYFFRRKFAIGVLMVVDMA
jgi:hypothetical protein